MGFNRDGVAELLAACGRRCCICHRFCGVKIETDHIQPKSEGGSDDIENAIPVCFECHAEIHSYNDKHPRGRKYTPAELRLHRERWLKLCADKPELTLPTLRDDDVGPLQALIDELEYNAAASVLPTQQRGALFLDEQFRRAISEGAIALLKPGLKQLVIDAYLATSRATQRILAEVNQDARDTTMGTKQMATDAALKEARAKVEKAQEELLGFLGREGPG